MSDYDIRDTLAYMMGMLIDHYIECDNLTPAYARRKVNKMSVGEISDNFRLYCYSKD